MATPTVAGSLSVEKNMQTAQNKMDAVDIESQTASSNVHGSSIPTQEQSARTNLTGSHTFSQLTSLFNTNTTCGAQATSCKPVILVSLVAWFRCLYLLWQAPHASARERLVHGVLLLLVIGMVGVWCWLYWEITFDAGSYYVLLGGLSGATDDELRAARNQLSTLLWQTALKIFFFGFTYGIVVGGGYALAAIWKRNLIRQFLALRFDSEATPPGCLLYSTAEQLKCPSKIAAGSGFSTASFSARGQEHMAGSTGLCKAIDNFVLRFSEVLFGKQFFFGALSMICMIITFAVYVWQQTGDTNGILFCFVMFMFCMLLEVFASWPFQRATVLWHVARARLQRQLESLTSHAEAIALYGSERYEALGVLRLLWLITRNWCSWAAGYWCVIRFS
jgi:hypothetical protein